MLLFCIILVALFHNSAATDATTASDPRPFLDVDFSSYLDSSDLIWGWNATGNMPLDPLTPTHWTQGAYIGNGLLGAMIIAIVDSTNQTTGLRVDVSRTDVWECSQRQPSAYLIVEAQSAPLARVDARLVLFSAELFLNFTLVTGDVVSFSMLVNANDPKGGEGVLMLFVSTLTGGADPLVVTFFPDATGPCSDKNPVTGYVSTSNGEPTYYATQTYSSGTVTVAYTDYNWDCGQTIILAIANSQRSADATSSLVDAIASVAAGVTLTIEGLEADNAAWWSTFWETSFFSFSADRPAVTRLESFTHIAGYRYASAARYSMHDLMGPWGPSHTTTCNGGSCQYGWDMNQQIMMYLPTPSNRGYLLGKPAFDMLPAALNGSWASLYGSNAPTGVSNILWWTAQVWRYALYHGDDARLLHDVLPALRSNLQKSNLKNGTDNLLHVVGCKSPEYPMGISSDCNYDLSILRWAAQTAQALALALQPDDPALPLYVDVQERLAPYPIDAATGSFEVAEGVPFSLPHRLYSHLLMIHDLHDLSSSAKSTVIAASLDVWFNITCSGPQARGYGGDECRGVTHAAMAMMSSMLDRGDAAIGNLTSYLRLFGLPNAMYGEGVIKGKPYEFSPASESAYAAAAAVYGTLITSSPAVGQSSGRAADATPLIELWPAAGAFDNATFFRLRCAGALLVSAVRLHGRTQWIAVEADLYADGTGVGDPVIFTLFSPDWLVAEVESLAVVAAPGVASVRAGPGTFHITGLVRGAAAAFYDTRVPAPVAFGVGVADGRNRSEANAWGSQFVFNGEYNGELP